MNYTIQLADLALAVPADIVSDWAPALSQDVRVVKLFRARRARQYTSGNALVTYTFTVSREHETVAAAATYLDDLPRRVRNANEDVDGAFTKSGGPGGAAVNLINATATFQARPARGVRTWVTYTVTGALPPALT